jgi:hypothetical protein
MKDQHVATLEEGEDILRPPPEAEHAAAFDALGEIGREGKAQIAAGKPHRFDALSGEHGIEAAHHGFDFRKLRHGALLDQFEGKDKNYP